LGDAGLVKQADARVDNRRTDLHTAAVVMSHCHLEREKLFRVACQLDYLLQDLAHIACDFAFVSLVRHSQVNLDKCFGEILLRSELTFTGTD
jgi:hypothetical protein